MEIVSAMQPADRTVAGQEGSSFAHDLMDTDMVLDSAPVPASQASTTNSQASSFQNSIPSQETGGSQFLPHAPSQSLPDQRNAASLTPPSSQSIPVPPSPHVLSNVQKPPVNGNLNSTSPIEPNASPSSALPQSNGLYQTASTHGQKRTASGQVKASSSSLPVSPIDGLPKGHSRKTPSISNIGELSAELKTRLSYAKVKVEKGWEKRTIDEVEVLASQHGSPKSSIASPRQPLANSPRTNIHNMYRDRGFVQSSERTTLAPSSSLPPPAIHNSNHIGTHAGYSSQPSSGYNGRVSSITNQGPSLAPPVDFTPRHPRRSSNQAYNAPSLAPNGARTTSNLSASSTSSITHPTTPPQRHRPTVKTTRTPRHQNTTLEDDAIETLIFMASPGNSQRHPNNHASQFSQLRSGFLPEKRAKEPLPLSSPRKRGFLDDTNLNLEDNEDIDRVLDSMPNGDSSSDDEDEDMGIARGVRGQKVTA